MQKITPFLWFNNNAEEAINFYVAVFKDTRILRISRYPDMGSGEGGKLITAELELQGQRFMVLNGGPQFKFTEAVSFFISCETQQEVDHLWEKLSDGGETGRCGWLKDKFGLSWQVVPTVLGQLLQGKDAQKAQNVMKAMMQMGKINIAALQQAYEQA